MIATITRLAERYKAQGMLGNCVHQYPHHKVFPNDRERYIFGGIMDRIPINLSTAGRCDSNLKV